MKRHGVLLVAMLAVMVAPLLSSPASSSPGSPAVLGNHEIIIKKLPGTNITACEPAGPLVLNNGNTIKFTNNTLNVVQVVYYNDANAQVASAVLNPTQSNQQVQGVGANRISYVRLNDQSKNQVQFNLIYAEAPGLGGPGLAALAILLMGSAAWALTRKRGESAV